jgi:hypothetical protein
MTSDAPASCDTSARKSVTFVLSKGLGDAVATGIDRESGGRNDRGVESRCGDPDGRRLYASPPIRDDRRHGRP